jgi:hypothetical protein
MVKIKIKDMLLKVSNSLTASKNSKNQLGFVESLIRIFTQLSIAVITVVAYVIFADSLFFFDFQATLIILSLLIVQLLHRWAANEFYFMQAWSCCTAKRVVLGIIAKMTMDYTPENPIIVGENTFYLFKATVFIKSTLEMGIMYIMLVLCAIDALLGFILFLSKKENDARKISLLMQTRNLLVFIYLMQVELYISL